MMKILKIWKIFLIDSLKLVRNLFGKIGNNIQHGR